MKKIKKLGEIKNTIIYNQKLQRKKFIHIILNGDNQTIQKDQYK